MKACGGGAGGGTGSGAGAGAGAGAPDRFQVVDLSPYLNHACASFDSNPFGSLGYSSLPAEELLGLGRPFAVEGVPFWLPAFCDGRPDNISCDCQEVLVPPGRYCALAVLGLGEMGSYREVVRLRFASGWEREAGLGLTRWGAPGPLCGEVTACTVTHVHGPGVQVLGQRAHVFLQVTALEVFEDLRSLVLPDNVFMHILALTLVRPPGEGDAASCPKNCAAGPEKGVMPCPARS